MATDGDNDGWGNVRFRPRRIGGTASGGDGAGTYVALGALLFVFVALAYPWYSYRVHSRLAERDARRALASIDRDFRTMQAQVQDALDEPPPPSLPAPPRLPSPRILGISEGATASVIVADLDGASLDDAHPHLCTDAARWTRRPIAGRSFRVQRYLGRSPAITAGVIRC
ncbi:MAG TPA: hypothetical protein VIG88_12180 [Lysobacter sp.]